jgi:hypothetical protein
MSFLSETMPNQLRRTAVTLGFFAFAIVAAYKLSQYVLTNDLGGLAIVGVPFVAGAVVLLILKDWRKGLYLFVAWLLFEDFARKFLGNNMAIYFAKDILLAMVYLSFFLASRRKEKIATFRPPFLAALLLFLWFGSLQVFNPGSSSLLYGILGMKLYFYYIPLVFVGYALIDSEAQLRRFFLINLVLMLAIIALGIVQSIAGPTFLNPEVMQDDIRLLSQTYRVAPISGVTVYRPTSVFVSAGRFSDMLIVAWMLVFGFGGYVLLRSRQDRTRTFAFAALAVTAAGCVLCASRGVFMWTLGSSLVGGAALLWGAPWRQGQATRVIRMLQRATLGVALAMIILLLTAPDALMDRLAVYSETLDPSSPASELMNRTRTYPMEQLKNSFNSPRWQYGYGIGTISLGNQYVSRIFHVEAPNMSVESGFGSLVIEMGIGGLILWIIMSCAVLISSWKVVKKLKGTPAFPLGFMIFWYAFLLLLPLTYLGLQPYQDFVMNAYLWLLLGVLFRLPTLGLTAETTQRNPVAPAELMGIA